MIISEIVSVLVDHPDELIWFHYTSGETVLFQIYQFDDEIVLGVPTAAEPLVRYRETPLFQIDPSGINSITPSGFFKSDVVLLDHNGRDYSKRMRENPYERWLKNREKERSDLQGN